ncbi:tail protein [Baekduia alba]|uniref:VgrG-related protein n=1 Tax=Baekduia alba TaxID=2997333 RepID=UPI0023426CEE|nr:VgrG-related protein [Baekduia alba]WCB93494.1 tail protein [Baekduia alba]
MTTKGPAPGVAGFRIQVSGTNVDAAVLAATTEIVVDGRLRVPDRLTLRLRDDDCAILDDGTFAVGTAITISLSSTEEADTGKVFDGQVTTLAPEFADGMTNLAVLALDRGCLLQRSRTTSTFQNMSYGSIASSLASKAGLSAGTISSGLTLPFVQQSNETDWDFLWRLALDVDYEVKVEGRALHFRPAGGAGGHAVPLALGDSLRAFAPRLTGVGQVDSVTVRGWDVTAAAAITANATPGTPQSSPGTARDTVTSALGSGTETVVDHPVLNTDHANQVAKAIAARIANAYVEGSGRAQGNPALLAGAVVEITGVGQAFSGLYALSGVRHVMRASTAYETHFFIDGREDRSLLGLATRGGQRQEREGWGRRIVVGVVSNNDDPDQLGRVRVRYPALDDSHEGWWARVVTPGAGAARGLASLPLVGDEVLVAFEHNNEQHPYVLGSVFNGQAKPGALTTTDGSFSWTSIKGMTFDAPDHVSVTTAGALTLTGVGKTTLTNKPGDTQKGTADVEVSATAGLALSGDTGVTLSTPQAAKLTATQSMTLDGGTELTVGASGKVTIKGATLQLSADSLIQISAPQVLLG